MSEKPLRALIKFEGNLFWWDMETFGKPDGKFTLDIFNPDGSRRPAKVCEVDFWDMLEQGHVLGDSLKDFRPEMLGDL